MGNKNLILGNTAFIFMLLMLCFTMTGFSQNMVVNGGFDDDSGWNVYNLDSGDFPSTATFGVTNDDGPKMGSGPFLYLNGEAMYTNILVWQELTLVGGETYEFSGAFKDLTGGLLHNFWSQIYIGPEEPVEGSDYTPVAGTNSSRILSINTWSGCGPNIDSTYQDTACDGLTTKFFTAPGEAGQAVSIYLGIKTGVWTDQTPLVFDVAVDEISLTPVNSTGIVNNPQARAEKFVLEQNYPNPFNPSTTINFSLLETDKAVLAIYDLLGHKIKTLANQTFDAGYYSYTWDGKNDNGLIMPSGVYFYKLSASQYNEIKKMTFLQ